MENINDEIRRTVAVLRANPRLGDDEVLSILVKRGAERVTAMRLVEFLPMVYCRLIFKASGARFANTYRRPLTDGRISSERLLSLEPVWMAAVAYAQSEVEQGASSNDLSTVAARSAEFDAANQLMNKGSRLENLVFSAPVLLWSDESG